MVVGPRRIVFATTLFVSHTLSLTAHADPPAAHPATSASPAAPAASAPASATAPDLVMLKDGGMVRGTISEMSPGEAVTIITIAGVTKRIPMSDVSYAGPADKAPKAGEAPAPTTPDGTRPFITVQGKAVPFKFVSQQPGLTLHIKTGEAEAVTWMGTPTGISAVAFTPICSAPCDATLPAGAHQLAVSKDNGRPVVTTDMAMLREPSILEATYESKQGVRTAGWVVLVGGLAAGAVIMFAGTSHTTTTCPVGDYSCVPDTSTDLSGIYIGGGVMIGAALVGGIMAMARDSASIAVSPRAAAN
jgi:hypothetical protein